MNLDAGKEWLFSEPLKDLNHIKIDILSKGQVIYDLSMINPDMAPPRFMIDKLLEASVKTINHKYSVSRGIKKLRQAFSEKYKNKFGIKLSAETQVCVTMGTKDALVNALMCLASPGEKVLLASPSYPAHVSACSLAGLSAGYFSVSNDSKEILASIRECLSKDNYKVIVLGFPNNPTGVVVDEKFYQDLSEIVREKGIYLINDFVYGEMCFDKKPAVSMLSVNNIADRSVEIYSLSKAYSVPGWRVGALVGNSAVIDSFARLKSHIDYGVFLPIQISAAAALTSPENLSATYVSEYAARAKMLVNGLKRLGWEVEMPKAGASVWAKMPDDFKQLDPAASKSIEFTRMLLVSQNVAVSPGLIYGKEFDNYVRFALVISLEKIHEVLNRIEKFSTERASSECKAELKYA